LARFKITQSFGGNACEGGKETRGSGINLGDNAKSWQTQARQLFGPMLVFNGSHAEKRGALIERRGSSVRKSRSGETGNQIFLRGHLHKKRRSAEKAVLEGMRLACPSPFFIEMFGKNAGGKKTSFRAARNVGSRPTISPYGRKNRKLTGSKRTAFCLLQLSQEKVLRGRIAGDVRS